ncbi:hypothetical protein DFR70_12737 [Nocardia tenerifensis]|uniref:Uncharacterized protein n=1 Tax=Nocardia tenerifensis TaxID=228006 RepID=A0A318JM45_9NOCA|nr:hypothetical protein [Nocardia tenerifensis]PXX53426.1 hypothetical protein DFR70_12737 [Nocardia tenerifensis]
MAVFTVIGTLTKANKLTLAGVVRGAVPIDTLTGAQSDARPWWQLVTAAGAAEAEVAARYLHANGMLPRSVAAQDLSLAMVVLDSLTEQHPVMAIRRDPDTGEVLVYFVLTADAEPRRYSSEDEVLVAPQS